MTQTYRPLRFRPVPALPAGSYRAAMTIYKTTVARFTCKWSGGVVTLAEAEARLAALAAQFPLHHVQIELRGPGVPPVILTATPKGKKPAPRAATLLEGKIITASRTPYSQELKDAAKRGTLPALEDLRYRYECLFTKKNGNHRGGLKGTAGKVAAYAEAQGISGPVSVRVIIYNMEWENPYVARNVSTTEMLLTVSERGKRYELAEV